MSRLTKGIASISSALALVVGGICGTSQQAYAANSGGEQPVYRLHNPVSHEHLYTTDINECNGLSKRGWQYEGVAWVAPGKSSTPVYRLYNPASRDHHYTTSEKERKTLTSTYGWRNEGITWYSDDSHTIQIWRQYNPTWIVGSHHYTSDKNEYDINNTRGWNGEGVAWYALKPGWAHDGIISPQAPSISNPEGQANDTVTIPSSLGVEYYVNGVKAAAGTHPVSKFAQYVVGEDNYGYARINIVAKELPGFQIKGTYTWWWEIPGDYVTPSNPTPPTPSNPPTVRDVNVVAPTYNEVSGKADTVTIPNIAGLSYEISGDKKTQTVSAGTYKVSDFSTYSGYRASITVVVSPKSGYRLLDADGGVIKTKTYSNPFSGLTIVDTNINQPTYGRSGMNGYYTIPEVTGIQWSVDGVNVSPGTYTVPYSTTQKTVVVKATAKSGYQIKNGSNNKWAFYFFK